jgi:hypothetical protein
VVLEVDLTRRRVFAWNGKPTGERGDFARRRADARARLSLMCVTLFPEMFVAVSHSGVTRRALEERALDSAAVESA